MYLFLSRAIAVRYSPQDSLEAMLSDVDEAVRRAVAYRLPREQLHQMMNPEDDDEDGNKW